MVIKSISELQISSPNSSASFCCKSWTYPSSNHFLTLYFLARSMLSKAALDFMSSERASIHVFRIWEKNYDEKTWTYLWGVPGGLWPSPLWNPTLPPDQALRSTQDRLSQHPYWIMTNWIIMSRRSWSSNKNHEILTRDTKHEGSFESCLYWFLADKWELNHQSPQLFLQGHVEGRIWLQKGFLELQIHFWKHGRAYPRPVLWFHQAKRAEE